LTEYLADSNSLAQIKADKAIKGSGTFLWSPLSSDCAF